MRLPQFFAILVALCLANSSHAQTVPAINVTADVSYRDYPLAPDEKNACQLDVYAPPNAKDLPVLVWFHGGGLTGGDKATRLTTALCRALASDGFVVASANYRLNPVVKYPTYLEDGAAVVAWMRHNATIYGGDAKRVFIGGHSAGTFLAALIGTDPRYLAKHGIAPSDIAGVVALSGQMTTHFTIRAERGLPETTILVDEAAPLYHAAKNTPPFLLLWGEKDMAMRSEENAYFATALRNAGNLNVRCEQIAERTHGGMIEKMAQNDDAVRLKTDEFLRAPTL